MKRYQTLSMLIFITSFSQMVLGASAEKAGAQPLMVAQTTASSKKATATKPAAKTARGTLLKESELKDKPFIDAKTITKLPKQTAVTILERTGGWFRIQAVNKSGWVRMLNVKVTAGAQNLSSGTDLTQAATLATGRVGSGNVVSTSGLRGLSEEELRTAKPDYAQFDKLNSFGVDKSIASNYAKQNGLTSRPVPYLPAPAK